MRLPALIAMLAFVPAAGLADAGEPTASGSSDDLPRHRIDLGTSFLDTFLADSFVATVGYTYNVTPGSNFNVTVPLIDPNTDLSGDSGVGDLVAAYSWVPSLRVGANPWVPRTVGTGIAVLAPTGDASDGRGLDAWIVAPFAGLVVPLTDRFVIAPQAGYVHSFGKTVDDVHIRALYAELGFSFVSLNGFWVTWLPQMVSDFEADDSTRNHRISIGKMFPRGFGLSLDCAWFDQINFDSDVPGETGFDREVDVNLHFTF